MQHFDIDALQEALSLERFGRYLEWAASDKERAIALYTLNCQLSESLYTSLHMLEVALRNRVHAVASGMTVGDQSLPWFERAEFQLGNRQLEQLEKAKADLQDDGKAVEAGRIVASLTFGYWTGFFGKPYENLWQQGLHRIARKSDGKGLTRKAFSKPLMPLRMLRNRIAHHEPIIYWDLPKHHRTILELTEWLSPAAAAWCRQTCRFTSVYPEAGIALVEPARVEAQAPPSQDAS